MAQYKVGLVSATNGSAVITGVGTLWVGEVSVGDIFTIVGSNAWYEVGSVDSNTQITLTANYAGTTISDSSYTISRDFTANYGLPYPQKGDIETASLIKRAFQDIDSKLVLTSSEGDVTITGDLIVQGSTISLDTASVQTFTWGDNDKAIFGDGSDLQIYSDGTTGHIDGSVILDDGTANGVTYLNGSKVLTSGSALTFDGTNFGIGTDLPSVKLQVNGAGTSGTSEDIAVFTGGASTVTGSGAKIYLSGTPSAPTTRAGVIEGVNVGGAGNGHALVFSQNPNGTNPVERLRLSISEAVFNEDGNDYDFRIESDTNSNAFFLRGSDGAVGMGTGSPAVSGLEISRATGSATPTPVELRLTTTTNASDWDAALDWGRISFYSQDTSTGGAKIHSAISVSPTGSTGGLSNMNFQMGTSVPSLDTKMQLSAFGSLYVYTQSGYESVFNKSGVDADFRVESDTNSHRLFVDAGNDAVLVGTGTPISTQHIGSSTSSAFLSRLQVVGSGVGEASITVGRVGGNNPPYFFLNAGDTSSPVVDQNALGRIIFSGNDGTNYRNGAEIQGLVNGTPSTGVMPGKLILLTSPTSNATPVERMSLSYNEAVFNEAGGDTDFRVESDTNSHAFFLEGSSGNVGIGTSSPAYKLTINDATGNYYPIALTSSSIGTAGNYVGMRFGYAGNTYQKAAVIFQSADGNGRGSLHFCLDGNADANNADINDSKLQLDYAGNLGLGVTPSGWGGFKAFDIGSGGALASSSGTNVRMFQNAYYNGTNYIYKTTNSAGRYDIGTGVHSWYTAPSGTAGNPITFSQAMTLTADGNLGVGTTSPLQRLDVASSSTSVFQSIRSTSSGTTNVALRIQDGTTGFTTANGLYLGRAGAINYLWIYESEPLVFGTSATERARITSTGDFLTAGKTSTGFSGAGAELRADGIAAFIRDSSSATLYVVKPNTANPTGDLVEFRYNTSVKVGSITYTASSVAYNTSSDYRLKENWVAVADASTRVNALNPVNFAWKADGSRVDGFLAHEVAEVVPEAVTGEKDAVDDEGNPVYQGIDQSKLVPLLTAALQEALAKIESLTARVSALEGN